jgi:hypothetical protein
MDLAARASQASNTSALRWSYCIRTKFRDVNIYQRGNHSRSESIHRSLVWVLIWFPVYDEGVVSAEIARLAGQTPKMAFEITWDLENLVQTALGWVQEENSEPSKSMVGTLSSNELGALTAAHLDGSLASNVRLLLYVTSQAHVKRDSPADVASLGEVAYFCGSNVLSRLNDLLSSRSLASAAKEALQARLLLIVSIILALGYTTQMIESPLFRDESDNQHQPTVGTLWEVMRVHVCEMLAHYLVVLASRLQFRFHQDFQKSLITLAPRH